MAEMTTQDIVKNCDEVKEGKLDWLKVYAILTEALKTNKYRMLRTNNTLFLIRIDSPGVAQMYIFNADTKHRLMGNMREFLKAMQVAKYNTVYGETHNVQVLRLLERAGFPGKIEQIESPNGKPLFRGTMNV
jgi:hypothetical protein